MNDEKRGTGRTTRMLEHAIDLEKQGKAVYVIAANIDHAKMLIDMTAKLYPGAMVYRTSGYVNGIKFEVPSSVQNFDWERMILVGAHPNCVVLVDHFTIESKFHRMLKMLKAYDLS